MKLRPFMAGAAFSLSLLTQPSAYAQSPTQPPRWVMVDDLRVRQGPSLDKKVIGTLQRGAELILKDKNEYDGFCLIEGEGQYGYIACKYLSATRIARPKAGEGGIDAAQRWVSGTALTLREAPRADAPVISRLALNTVVKLVREEPGSGYCEVQPASGARGYTACRYLATTPTVVANVRGYRSADAAPSSAYDPVRAFWLEPSWQALEDYATYLKSKHPEILPQGPWPRDEALEKMKAHLALGIKGEKPGPFADWQEMKRKAWQNLDMGNERQRLENLGQKVPDYIIQREFRSRDVANQLLGSLGLFEFPENPNSLGGDARRAIRLVRELEFPKVQPSLFRDEFELAGGSTNTEQASGRFDIIFRQVLTPRPKPLPSTEAVATPGLYDMLKRTQVLVRPVQRVQLFRDGRLQTENSLLRISEPMWIEVEQEECEGYTPGFAFGDANGGISVYTYYDKLTVKEILKKNPAGSLYAFYTNISLPAGPTKHTETPMRLDRKSTGFIGGTYLYYDLDGDGIVDIAVWEGHGKGRGHLEGPTETDDRWYRLVMVNINGAWKVLGSDEYSYGCGC